MPEPITAKDFFLNTFNHDFLLPGEIETIITAMELYAKGKCNEYRKALEVSRQRLEEWNGVLRDGSIGKAKNNVVIDLIDNIIPKEHRPIDPRNYDSDLVYQRH